MENELTHRAQVPYSVSSMDEQVDAKASGQSVPKEKVSEADQRKKDQEEAASRKITLEQLYHERSKQQAKRFWEENLRRRREAGQKITKEEEDEIKKKIERGEMPTIGGGSGDGKFENFPVDKFKGTRLEELAKKLKEAGERDAATEEFLNDLQEQIFKLVGLNLVTDQQGAEFQKEINEVLRTEVSKKKNNGSSSEQNQEGDGNLENIADPRFLNSPLGPLAKEIAEFGASPLNKFKIVSDEQRADWNKRARQVQGEGMSEELLSTFLSELKGWIDSHNGDIAVKMQKAAQTQQGGGDGLQERLENTPRSIQEICKWIIRKEGDEWGPNGPNPLLDTIEPGKEAKFNQANFVKWVRERMLHFHNLDPNNPSVNLLGSVGIETEFKTIGIISMINNKKQYFKDEITNEVYSDLVEDIVNEVYLFQTSRNHDASYRFAMWSDEELPKLLQQIHQKSDFTNGEQMKKIFSFSADYGEGDTKVGDTIRTMYEAYYSISDYDELQRVLGKDSVFFTRKGFEDAWRLSQHKRADEPVASNYAELFDKLFESRDPGAKPKIEEFMKFINLFNDTGKKETEINLVREALRVAGSQVHGLETGLNSSGNERNVKRKNLEYAEMWAYSMVRWTGAAARNDTNSIGYDAFTKTQRFQQYRIRQSSAGRGAPIGNQYDLPVIKAWNLDLFNGIFVEKAIGENKQYTPYEIFRMLDEVDGKARAGELNPEQAKIEKERVFNLLKFKQYTQLDYANNHLGKSFQMFHSMLGATELNLDQIVTHDRYRGLVFDRSKFEENVKENFIKPIRYALNTYGNIDYSKDMRVQVNPGKEPPKYETKTFAEAMFGPVVLQGFYKKEKGPNGEPIVDKELLGSEKGRNRLYKHVIRSIIASHLQAHRKYNSGYAFMNEGQITKFIEALESIRQMEIDDVGENTQLSEGDHFFTHEDIAWIRKYSGTENWKLVLRDVIIKEGGMGAIEGLFKGFKDYFSDITKG